MDIDEIRQTLLKWLQGVDEITPLALSMLQCHLLLVIAEKLNGIEGSISQMASDDWDDHHNK